VQNHPLFIKWPGSKNTFQTKIHIGSSLVNKVGIELDLDEWGFL
jgi:hypothetical protein